MTDAAESPAIVDVPDESRFVFRGPGAEAELQYHLNGSRLVLIHTEVPDALERARARRPPGARRARPGRTRGPGRGALVPVRPALVARASRRGGPRDHRLGHAAAPESLGGAAEELQQHLGHFVGMRDDADAPENQRSRGTRSAG